MFAKKKKKEEKNPHHCAVNVRGMLSFEVWSNFKPSDELVLIVLSTSYGFSLFDGVTVYLFPYETTTVG